MFSLANEVVIKAPNHSGDLLKVFTIVYPKLYSFLANRHSSKEQVLVIKFIFLMRYFVNKKRPININPLSIQLPLPALVSISHRLSGILVFLLIPLMLWALQLSLVSPEGLNQVRDCFYSPTGKFVVWIGLAGVLFHLCAGLRHLLMDVHVGDSLKGGRWGAMIVSFVSFLLILGAAYWIGR